MFYTKFESKNNDLLQLFLCENLDVHEKPSFTKSNALDNENLTRANL